MPVLTPTIEGYLKNLYLEQYRVGSGLTVSTSRLASAMQVTAGTATAMIKSMSSSGLVEYEMRRGVRLSPRGEKFALHVLRRHRLMELFLVRALGLDWSIVHAEAETLEHAISDRVLERIDAFLGHPSVDPHGDPIPRSGSHVESCDTLSLANCQLKKSQRVNRILDHDPDFLKWVEREGLVPGAKVAVLSRQASAGTARVRVDGRKYSSLSLIAAAKILVEAAVPSRKILLQRASRNEAEGKP